jgi:hypothetical protein
VMNQIHPRLTPPRSTGFGLDSIGRRYSALSVTSISVKRENGQFLVRIPLIVPIHENTDHRG